MRKAIKRIRMSQRGLLIGLTLALAVWSCITYWYAPPPRFSRMVEADFEWDSAHGFSLFVIKDNWPAEQRSNTWKSLVAAQIKPHLASFLREGHLQKVKGRALIEVLKGIPVALPDSWGSDGLDAEDLNRTPLMRAAMEGNTNSTERLLDAKAEVNAKDYWERTPLLFATEGNKPSPAVIKDLLAWGADPNARDRGGYTPLLAVIMSKPTNERFEIVRDLIDAGADPNSMDNSGQTALMAAAENDAFDTVRFLLAAGADPSRRTNYGETAISIATRLHFDDIVSLLRRAGEIK